ncbi:hypothetical protein CONLIGDRAFT_705138 [Coniochaeta ligniaria NRRL 30616]|uniref:Asl1-like glycosyl hydrolase catalytic domain-containing protein n=1 Tax=Coniochaeta ligniaria NRRL 30616 TaxID=1408157 RepID=A0A1J7J217_9PEZI|nr:hypothetical protein CONLIGDRAFT_705138 [Coniochaeta ligniaria NRRL 30616]
MYAKNIILLAAASLIADAVAVNVHRHGHGQMHQNQKKDLKIETEFATVTEWVTVTYDPNAPTTTAELKFAAASHSQDYSRTRKFSQVSSSSSTVSAPETSSVSSSVAEPTPSSSSIVEVPTTLIAQVKPTEVEKAPSSTETPVAAPATTEAAAPTTAEAAQPAPTTASASAAPASTGGKKRGLAYNDPSLLSGFVGDNTKVSWCYNWGQTNDQQQSIEFIPMLWSPTHASTWETNANKAIAAGSSALLSFNEPDNAGQANMDPASAATAHIQYMNPFKGKARISTPAITNSGTDGQGISWLTQWVTACAGNCHYDFAAVHWYSDYTDTFLQHLKDVYAAVQVPVWVTEFAPVGNSVDYNTFLATVVHELDNNPDYAFVERYSFFMVSDGEDRLVTGGQPNTLGNTFAYAS